MVANINQSQQNVKIKLHQVYLHGKFSNINEDFMVDFAKIVKDIGDLEGALASTEPRIQQINVETIKPQTP